MQRRTLRRLEICLHVLLAGVFVSFCGVGAPLRQGILFYGAVPPGEATFTYASQSKTYELTAANLAIVESIERGGFLLFMAAIVIIVVAAVLRHLINEADRKSAAPPPP